MTSSVQVSRLVKEWNGEIEDYLKNIGEKSQIYSLLHKNSEKKYNKISYQFDIPNIVIATVAGTLSISSSSLFQGMEKEASIFIGILSLTSSILTTVNSYFGFKKRCETHRLVSIQYQKLFLKIDLVLGLKHEERPSLNEFIKFVTDEFNRLAEISPIIDTDLMSEFKNKFKEYVSKVSFPNELNGLSNITIYKSAEEIISEEHRNKMLMAQHQNNMLLEEHRNKMLMEDLHNRMLIEEQEKKMLIEEQLHRMLLEKQDKKMSMEEHRNKMLIEEQKKKMLMQEELHRMLIQEKENDMHIKEKLKIYTTEQRDNKCDEQKDEKDENCNIILTEGEMSRVSTSDSVQEHKEYHDTTQKEVAQHDDEKTGEDSV
jgi:hypothetical protein